MQFCCDLKKEAIYQHYVKSILAVWLMMLFMSTSFFQIFHHHHEELANHKYSSQTTIQKGIKSCEVCDYLGHHQAVPILNAHHFELTPPVKSTAAFAGRYYIGCYKFTLQGFTNKGPPTIHS